MLTPIVPPITTANPKPRPSMRSSLSLCAKCVSAAASIISLASPHRPRTHRTCDYTDNFVGLSSVLTNKSCILFNKIAHKRLGWTNRRGAVGTQFVGADARNHCCGVNGNPDCEMRLLVGAPQLY